MDFDTSFRVLLYPTFLQVDILQSTMDGHESKTPFLRGGSTSTSHIYPAMAPFPQGGEPSQHDHGGQQTPITGTSGHLWSGIGVLHPKRPVSLALGAPPPLMLESYAKTVDTSSQVSPQVTIPDNAEPDILTLEEISLPIKTLGLGASILPGDVVQLQEEVGKALGFLLATRSSLNACHRKQVSDFEMALHQNKSETTKAIKEAKTLCAHTTREAEVH